jgi:small conductance mechanosensitive channel
MDEVTSYADQLKTLVMGYLPSLVMAIVVLIVGWWIIGRVGKVAERGMGKLDVSLRTFLRSLITITLKILLLVSVIGMVGIQTTSFIAILGAAGLAVGLALQGTLANFAGGVLILIFKPYKVGDIIEAQGKTGAVTEIQIFNTVLNTLKGETIILPNGAVSNGTITNYTQLGRALVEIPVDLAGKTSVEELRNSILPVIRQDSRIMQDPQPMVGILSLKPGSMQVVFRAYTEPSNVIAVTGWMIETVKNELEKNKFAAPIPHSFVHTIQEK